MKKKAMCIFAAFLIALSIGACGQTQDQAAADRAEDQEDNPVAIDSAKPQEETKPIEGKDTDSFHIGIVTGSFSQSEDDRRGAEAFQEKYGTDNVTLAIYPDNFTEDLDTTIQIIVGLADDPDMKAIVVNQAVDGTTEAFRQIHEKRPDILCFAGEAYEDFEDIGEVADLVVNYDFISRGYLIVHSAHELGCDTFVHISFPRHLSYESVSRQAAIMKAACSEFGMKFAMEEAPDPITEVGVPGAKAYIAEHVSEWVDRYGQKAAYFCTNDAHTEPLIKGLMEYGGYFIEADLPSPLMGYPGALDLDLTDVSEGFENILHTVEDAVVSAGGAGRFGTWSYSYGYSVSAGLAEHARNVILGESDIQSVDDLAKAYGVFSPGAQWNGSNYTDSQTGDKADNIVLIYQDTYIFGNPGHYMGTTQIDVPDDYFTIE
ncbi:MAG: DUF3798 domain-containing protein [Lachnospiraceae bacterium]|nr:DUF3798 domain-containing protein [Lachnospiraceae bacterium]